MPDYMFLLHMNDDPTKPLWQDPVAEFAQYSASSLSLMSRDKPYVYSKFGMVQGVIFRVPLNNVLVNYRTDLMTSLHVGSLHTGAIEHTFAEEMTELMAATAAHGLETPQSLLQKTNDNSHGPSVGLMQGSNYNEVVVCGKTGVPLPWGVTSDLTLIGMFMLTTKAGVLLQPFDAAERERQIQAHALRLNVPMLYLPNQP